MLNCERLTRGDFTMATTSSEEFRDGLSADTDTPGELEPISGSKCKDPPRQYDILYQIGLICRLQSTAGFPGRPAIALDVRPGLLSEPRAAAGSTQHVRENERNIMSSGTVVGLRYARVRQNNDQSLVFSSLKSARITCLKHDQITSWPGARRRSS
ncbi:hypothetical protein BST61_g5704 [Cercospora zeina]